MRRILFSWHGFNVYSYPAMLYLGMIAGVFSGAQLARSAGMEPDRFAIATVLLAVPALVGSRLLFVFHLGASDHVVSFVAERSRRPLSAGVASGPSAASGALQELGAHYSSHRGPLH
jgi:prolipoprotein diacylglyceryltransferase